MSYYLGVDAGATRLRAAVATDPETVLGRGERPTPNADGRAVSAALLETVRAACADAGVGVEEIAAAGVGSFGPIDREAGAIVRPANVAAERIPIVGPLRDLLETDRIDFRNDADAGVRAERYAADTNLENVAYLTISTGIGAGVIVDGCLLSGNGGNAGEVGHTTVDAERRMECGCGGAGHWEAYCSGGNIPHYAGYLHSEGTETDLSVGEEEFTAADVFATPEDDLAAVVIEHLAQWNTVGVANLVQSFGPTHVAVGGAVALNNPEAVVEPVRQRLPGQVTIDAPTMAPTALGDEVVLVGALVGAVQAE